MVCPTNDVTKLQTSPKYLWASLAALMVTAEWLVFFFVSYFFPYFRSFLCPIDEHVLIGAFMYNRNWPPHTDAVSCTFWKLTSVLLRVWELEKVTRAILAEDYRCHWELDEHMKEAIRLGSGSTFLQSRLLYVLFTCAWALAMISTSY